MRNIRAALCAQGLARLRSSLSAATLAFQAMCQAAMSQKRASAAAGWSLREKAGDATPLRPLPGHMRLNENHIRDERTKSAQAPQGNRVARFVRANRDRASPGGNKRSDVAPRATTRSARGARRNRAEARARSAPRIIVPSNEKPSRRRRNKPKCRRSRGPRSARRARRNGGAGDDVVDEVEKWQIGKASATSARKVFAIQPALFCCSQ